MSRLIEYMIKRLKSRESDLDFPIEVHQGTDYGGETGSSFSTLEIDWEKLQADMQAFEDEFKAEENKR